MDGAVYLNGLKLALVILALCLGVLLLALDNAMIATALPTITDEFNSVADVGWYGSAYLLTATALNLFVGKLYTFFSVKWMYLICIAIFEVGSVICAVAPSSIVLIIGRAIAGIGGAGLFVGALVILAYSVPLERRPIFAGCIGSMYGISSVAGPLLGGLFTETIGWRWCFWMNLPVGGIALVVVFFCFHDPQRKIPSIGAWERFKTLDPLGSLAFICAMICILLALQWGGQRFAWRSAEVIGLLAAGAVMVGVFGWIQHWNGENATVPPRLLNQRTVWASGIFAFCLGAAFLLTIYWFPTWFQGVRGTNAIDSGLRILPMLGADIVISLVSGVVISYFGYIKPVMMSASILMAVGYGLMSTFQPDAPTWQWVLFPMLAGAGVGAGLQQPMMAMQTVLPIRDVPTGTAVMVFVQGFGSTMFLTVGNTVFNNLLKEGVRLNVPMLDPELAARLSAETLLGMLEPEWRPALQAVYNSALTRCFFVSAIAAAVSFIGASLIEWRNIKKKPGETEGAADNKA
ncbi:putative efflux pump antibiotic resistance protein [Sodiomyces alkalinus F11]|uniref:Putative efflux pump antibiotic resistance protein n=1 Tax=Sodiomyces alkalinus (strain CBS 110278 / VKM F-3762 / F11) TaxID=1314773 RepID=A0A3N2PRE0_SODAK|nr:putative efflux pump antibiotic resistance protein [Sodiomyces alkalinus F11]ROT37081.1 putative efflux pump antibiotic resistance protein [Sodiomyces alkalinus F11]